MPLTGHHDALAYEHPGYLLYHNLFIIQQGAWKILAIKFSICLGMTITLILDSRLGL